MVEKKVCPDCLGKGKNCCNCISCVKNFGADKYFRCAQCKGKGYTLYFHPVTKESETLRMKIKEDA